MNGLIIFYLAVAYLVNIILSGWLASEKNRSVLFWVFLSIVFPAVSLIAVAGAPDETEKPIQRINHEKAFWEKQAGTICPICGRKCERCGRPHENKQGRGLNAHHLDWNRSNCAWWNLACLCAKCHLFVQKETERQNTWMLSNAPWLQKHIDGYIQSIIDKITNNARSSWS